MSKPLAPIPEPPRSADPALKQFLGAMKEALEVRLGRRGDPLEEAVTKRELIDSKLATLRNGTSGQLGPAPTVPPGSTETAPPMPIGFTAIGVFGGIMLTWETPYDQYNAHAYAEIWRGESQDAASRVLLNSARGSTYFDAIPQSEQKVYYYWLRFLNEFGQIGPFAGPVGASKERNVEEIMKEISGQIDESDLSQAFKAGYTGMKDQVANQQQQLTYQSTQITQQAEISRGLAAQYTLRLNVNGYISGFGAYNSGTTSDFTILADRFWIAPPNSTGKVKPFIIQNGVTYIDTAMIRDASIQEGKLGPITFGKIRDQYGQPVTTLGGKLRADAIDVTSLQVTDANIAGVIRSNQVASNGQPRWMLDKNGGMTLNGSGAQGRMEIRDTVIKVFDNVGRLRVQLGDLTL